MSIGVPKDKKTYRQHLDKLLDDGQIQSIEIRFNDLKIDAYWKEASSGSKLNQIKKDYLIYPNSSRKFSIQTTFEEKVNLQLYIIMALLAICSISLAIYLFYKQSTRVINKELHQIEIDIQKNKIAARILHQIQSDANQIDALVEDKHNNFSIKNKILLRGIKNTILNGVERFTAPDKKIVSPIQLKTIVIQDFLHDLIARKNIEFSKYTLNPIILELNNLGNTKVDVQYENLISAFSELINNARDAIISNDTCNGQIMIKLSATDSLLEVSIIDNGIGIPEQEINNVFEDGYTLKGNKGNGIGLPNALSLVKSMEGDLNLTSVFNHGTTVRLFFLARFDRVELSDYDSVYIDDSKLCLLNAEKKAEINGKRLLTYSTFDEYFNELVKQPTLNLLHLYTDSDLGLDLFGEEYAQVANEQYGVKNITVATGDPEKVDTLKMPWIKAVISKETYFNDYL